MSKDLYKLRTHDVPASKITDNLWLGNYENAIDEGFLQRERITVVVNVMEAQPYFLHGIAMAHFPLTQPFGTDATFYKALLFLKFCIGGQDDVLIHCWEGIDRSATLVMKYLEDEERMSRADAIELIKEKRPVANPRPEWLEGF